MSTTKRRPYRRFADPVESFRHRIERDGECVIWLGEKDHDGYGVMRRGGKRQAAHRFSWELANGPIPAGMQIDHMCHNRLCVRPEHLRLATNKQNQENRRGAQRNSRSGIRGVYRDSRSNRWRAVVYHNRKAHYFGRFQSLQDAEAAVVAKRAELFTHSTN